MTLREKIKRIRLKKRMSQAKVAQLAELDPSYISKIETGKVTKPELDTVRKIAAALGMSISDLYEGTEEYSQLRDALEGKKTPYREQIEGVSMDQRLFSDLHAAFESAAQYQDLSPLRRALLEIYRSAHIDVDKYLSKYKLPK